MCQVQTPTVSKAADNCQLLWMYLNEGNFIKTWAYCMHYKNTNDIMQYKLQLFVKNSLTHFNPIDSYQNFISLQVI
jgi:hypothetical protein